MSPLKRLEIRKGPFTRPPTRQYPAYTAESLPGKNTSISKYSSQDETEESTLNYTPNDL